MKWKRGSIALLLSILQPGLGQVYNRQLTKGICFLAFTPLVFLFARLTGLLHRPQGLDLFLAVALTIEVWAIIDAVRIASTRLPESSPARLNRWGLALAIALAVLNIAGGGSRYYFKHLLGVGAYVMASNSMVPTLRGGDRLLVDENAYSKTAPRRGDVAAFLKSTSDQTIWVKRVIAVGGDVIEETDGVVKLNGQILSEPYLSPTDESEPPPDPFGPVSVPVGKFFVMGDDRQLSYDSRSFGFVDSAQMRGKVLYLYWSKDHSRIGQPIR